jgi:hypothetical protein
MVLNLKDKRVNLEILIKTHHLTRSAQNTILQVLASWESYFKSVEITIIEQIFENYVLVLLIIKRAL